MIIAQNSVNIDENALLAYKNSQDVKESLQNDYNKKLHDAKTEYTSYMHGRVTNSMKDPSQVADINTHVNGDLWVQQSQDGQQAVGMWYWQDGAWQPERWDAETLRVKELSALNANLGHVTSGIVESVSIVSATLDVDINGNLNAHDSGHNPATWDASGFDPNDLGSPGFHFHNGLMQLRARQVAGSYPGTWDSTFMGPNDFKLRSTTDSDTAGGNVVNRVDVRSDYVEIAKGYYTPHTSGNIWNSTDEAQLPYYMGSSLNSDGTVVASTILYANRINAGGGWIRMESKVTSPYRVNTPGIDKDSDESLKRDISSFTTKKALSEILGTDIYSYRYKSDPESLNIGPVIDDKNPINNTQYNISEYMVNRYDNVDTLSLDNAVGMLIGSVQELSKQNEKLLARIAKLEAHDNGNN